MGDVNDGGRGDPRSTQFIEGLINEVRRATAQFTSPTAREVCQNAVHLLETSWLIETQGGVINQQPQQQLGGTYSTAQGYQPSMQRTGGAGPQNSR